MPRSNARRTNARSDTPQRRFISRRTGHDRRAGHSARNGASGSRNALANRSATLSSAGSPTAWSRCAIRCRSSCAASNRRRVAIPLSVLRNTMGRPSAQTEKASRRCECPRTSTGMTPWSSSRPITSEIGPIPRRHTSRTCAARCSASSIVVAGRESGVIASAGNSTYSSRCRTTSRTIVPRARTARCSRFGAPRRLRKWHAVSGRTGGLPAAKNCGGTERARLRRRSVSVRGRVFPCSSWLMALGVVPTRSASSFTSSPEASRARVSRSGVKLWRVAVSTSRSD